MKIPTQDDLNRMSLRVYSASQRQSATMQELQAALMTGSQSMLRAAYANAVDAYATLLDTIIEQGNLNLRSMGIDPDQRGP